MGSSLDIKDARSVLALSAVIIIFVAIALVWAVGLFWNPAMEPVEEPTEVKLRNPVATAKSIEGEDYWDVTVEVAGFVPKDEKLYWQDLRLEIRSEDGRILLTDARIRQNDPPAYDDGSDGWVDVQPWYIYESTHTPYMTAGSYLKITGLNREHEGGVVKVFHNGERIGAFTIPSLAV